VGYPKETKGYYVYYPADNRVSVVRNGIFLEREFISKRASGSQMSLKEVRDSHDSTEPQMEHGEDSQRVDEPPPPVTQGPRRSDRV